MKKLFIALLVLVVLVGIGWLWIDHERDSTTTVDKTEAQKIANDDVDDASIEPGERPVEGTYGYTGTGSDNFDALGGSSHEFAKQVFAVVSLDADDSCSWTWTMPFVKEHVEERSFCTKDAAVLDLGFERTTEFIGRRQTSAYECSDTAWRIPPADTKQPWAWTCTEERGGLVNYTGRIVGDEQVDIDGTKTKSTHVRIDGVQKDKSTGTERTDVWLLPSGLPVRFSSDRTLTVPTPIGKMTTTEQWDYRIDSLEPSEQ